MISNIYTKPDNVCISSLDVITMFELKYREGKVLDLLIKWANTGEREHLQKAQEYIDHLLQHDKHTY